MLFEMIWHVIDVFQYKWWYIDVNYSWTTEGSIETMMSVSNSDLASIAQSYRYDGYGESIKLTHIHWSEAAITFDQTNDIS